MKPRPTLSSLPRPSSSSSSPSCSFRPSTRPDRRPISTASRFFPQPPPDPRRRAASTSVANTDWLAWLKRASALTLGNGVGGDAHGGKALLFAGLGSYPHTPYQPTPASMGVWEQASEALLTPDHELGYGTAGMEQFVSERGLGGAVGVRGWMRGWVEGRTLDELMGRADVTAAFIVSSSIAILASEQEKAGGSSLIPRGTTHLAGHGFTGTLTALVATGRLDLSTAVRLARMYAMLPPSPPSAPSRKYLTTVLSARHFHSLSSPPWDPPPSSTPYESGVAQRRRVMQLILDEVHGMQKDWEREGEGEWAGAGIINSSRVLVVKGTQSAVLQTIERLQELNLANPVMDVLMPCPYHTPLMSHAVPQFRTTLSKCHFRDSPTAFLNGITILDPMTTLPIGPPAVSLLPHLTSQLRWHKTLSRLYTPVDPPVRTFLTVGRGAKGLGVMLRGELKRRQEGSPEIDVQEFGVRSEDRVVGRHTRLSLA